MRNHGQEFILLAIGDFSLGARRAFEQAANAFFFEASLLNGVANRSFQFSAIELPFDEIVSGSGIHGFYVKDMVALPHAPTIRRPSAARKGYLL